MAAAISRLCLTTWLGTALSLAACVTTPERPQTGRPAAPRPAFEMIGHRGARGLLPENTLPGFARALTLGVTVLELDVGVSKDGRVVVSHQPHLNPDVTRDAEENWLLADGPALIRLTLDELRTYDVGRLNPRRKSYAQRFKKQQPIDRTAIPTLDEVISLWRHFGRKDVRLDIEIKSRPDRPEETLEPARFAAKVVEVLRRKAALPFAAIQSYDWRTLAHVRRLAPELETICLTSQQSWLDNVQRGRPGPSAWTNGLDVDDFAGSVPRLVERAGCNTWSVYRQELDAAQVAKAHALGLKVLVWTVNSKAEMEHFVKLGVDGIISDYPDKLRQVLIRLGVSVPPLPPSS